MTREEAWEAFKDELIRNTRMPITLSYDLAEKLTEKGITEALAKWKPRLEQEPKTQFVEKSNFDIMQYNNDLQSAYDCGKASQEPKIEPCEDCISRHAVIERIQREEKVLYTPTGMNYLIRAINELPSVTPKEQKAETVTEFADRCKECGARYGRLLQEEPKVEQKIRKELSLLSTYRVPNSATDLISYRAVERVLNLVFRGNRDLEPYKESEG